MIPFASACLVTAFDCNIGYNYTLENHFDVTTMDEELASFKPPDNLYDAVARAWDSRNCPHTQDFCQKRPRYLADLGYRLRRSSYEERRGAVSVRPSEVNSLRSYPLSLDCEDFPAPQSPSISLYSHVGNSTASDGPIVTQCDDHPSDADDEMDDCGYSTDGTMSWQPHGVTQDSPTHSASASLSSVSWSDGSEDGYASSIPDVESDDGYDNINSPPPCTPTSSNVRVLGTRTVITKKRRNASAPPGGSTKRRKYLRDEQKATTRKPYFSSGTFTPTYGTDDSEYEPLASVKGRSPDGPKQTLFPCLLDGCRQVCYSATDLARHRQCLRHRAPEYSCLGCRHPFTRPDALKRHLNGKPACKQAHRAALVASKA
ncbi:hypothetical protein DFJ58DRAFT_728038 [Suillus subalutaceus]|uniref:uncharacterized protein n=1 Tax=Suillus subalutaceus TaxID=48586 RepID=UPI001B865F0A|nr:uncharacterized protein DFJ58DRAFT_728038 [Suillus subalutaceus]KAG1853911.1 hypothetical protein DFJ58DRAFT_728038 [Suillus subalutaceus]